MGMKTLLLLRTAQFKRRPSVFEGNILIHHIMGAQIRIVKMKIDEDPAEMLESEAQRLRREGHNPYVLGLPAGVSGLAAVAYVDAMNELIQQATDRNLDVIIVATSAGATQAGLTLGAKMLGLKAKVIGINVGAFRNTVVVKTVLNSSLEAAKILGSNIRLTPGDINIKDEYVGSGYGVPTKASIAAIRSVARSEALILDPVYTSKAMAGLIDMIKRRELQKDQNVCFVHTGGIPALFAYKQYFQPKSKS
jgi:1-aminocyclopropane-1-carboxylate deaminase/D-cysteine desulfhydrase-like pyridoxal-dependent ACC family enzyme